MTEPTEEEVAAGARAIAALFSEGAAAEAALTAAYPLLVRRVAKDIARLLWEESQKPLAEQREHDPSEWRFVALGGRAVGLQRAVDIANEYTKEVTDD